MDIQNVNLQTALHLAVERQHTQIVRVSRHKISKTKHKDFMLAQVNLKIYCFVLHLGSFSSMATLASDN